MIFLETSQIDFSIKVHLYFLVGFFIVVRVAVCVTYSIDTPFEKGAMVVITVAAQHAL